MKVGIHFWILTVIFKTSVISAYYSKYYVEDSCVFGNETIEYEASDDESAGILKATAHPPYAPNMHCTILIKASKGQGIVLSIRKIDLRYKRHHICKDYIQVFYSDPFGSPATICRFKFDLTEEVSYYSEGTMKIVFHTGSKDDLHYEEGFALTFTAASEDLDVCKSDDKFMCNNMKCIWEGLTCDGRNNCGDNSDESTMLCDAMKFYDFRLMDIVYTTTICLVVVITLTSVIMVCRYRRRRILANDIDSDDSFATGAGTPYHAVHPSGFFICQNPAGPNSLLPCHQSVVITEGGFANPCYPTGVPQSSYPSKQ